MRYLRLNDIIEQVVIDRDNRSISAPPCRWQDVDTKDEYEAAITKDGEWMVVTRVSVERGEVVRFEIPREMLRHCVRHLGGELE